MLIRTVSKRGAVSPLRKSAGASLSGSRPPLPQDRQRNAALSRFTSSGLELEDDYVFVYRIRDGLVTEGWEYRTKDEALAASVDDSK